MSKQRTDLDEVVAELAEFEAGDTVRLVTDAGSLTATVTDTRWHPDAAVIALEDRDADRRVRVFTTRYNGWLDPLVDALPPADLDSESTFDGDLDFESAESDLDRNSDFRRPIGTLVDVRLVATAADQYGRGGRP